MVMIISKKISMLICLMLCLIIAAAGAGCGKKGPPTMKSFEKPDPVKDIRMTHRDGKIDIAWSYPKQKRDIIVKGIHIDKAEGKGAYETIATLPEDATQYTDANVKLNAQYRYKLRVVNARGVIGDDSPELKIVPVAVPDPVQGLAYKLTSEAVEISWNKSADGVLYNVYRSSEKGTYPGLPLNEKPLDKPFFRDSLNTSAKVYYAVIAVVQSTLPNESALSDEIEIDPQQAFIPAAPVEIRYVRSDFRGYISWKDNAETWVSGYRIYRKRASGAFGVIAEVKVPVFLDEERITEETSYYITAVGPVKESKPSEIVTVKP
jgi:fibronectin type 3 domain-containing protein/predicted small lipoprotein YifL